MTVYIVTTGEYSDYCIRAVFTDREKAEEYVREYNACKPSCTADWEDWEADAEADMVATVLHGRCIHMDSGELTLFNGTRTYLHPKGSREATVNRHPGPIQHGGSISVWSPVSSEHAAKVAVEARQAWLREQALQPA